MERIIENNILLQILIGKKWSIPRHICMIVFFAILFYPDVDLNEEMVSKFSGLDPKVFIAALNKTAIILYFITLTFIYLNFLFFIPKFLLKNKISLYVFCCAISILLIFILDVTTSRYCLKNLAEIVPTSKLSFKGFVDSALIPVVFLAATAGYEIFKKWIVDSALLTELKQNKIEQELTNLKNQINPHFLFNTLNNLHTLIDVNPAKASSVVLGLSDVLRYQLYEANDDKVVLKKDIEVLQQYLDLEKIRRDNFQFSIEVDGVLNSVLVPPFIFINFVENAIKHSVDNQGFSFIALKFSKKNTCLYFECKNSKPSVIKAKLNGGLGLKNIGRRLELIYGERHTLEIKEDSKEFLLSLSIPL